MKVFVMLVTFTINPAIVQSVNNFVSGGAAVHSVEFSTMDECQSSLNRVFSHYSGSRGLMIADGVCLEKNIESDQTQETNIEEANHSPHNQQLHKK